MCGRDLVTHIQVCDIVLNSVSSMGRRPSLELQEKPVGSSTPRAVQSQVLSPSGPKMAKGLNLWTNFMN